MNLKIVLALLLLTFSCENSKVPVAEISGKYTTENVSLLKRLEMKYFKNTIYGRNVTLQLNSDSTFLYSTCSNLINGHWSRNNENVIFTCIQNIKIVDSSLMKCGKWIMKIDDKKNF